jgi:thioredoxin-dependent peroxiredoxin
MTLRLGDVAPDFVANSTSGLIHFHEYVGSDWCVFFSHPKDFTPVCTTEIGYMARMQQEFKSRNTKLLCISIDTVDMHNRWKYDIAEIMGCDVYYPMIGDPDLSVAKLYGLIHPNAEGMSEDRSAADNQTARSLFIIGPDKKVKAMIVYPMVAGRNFEEVLRILDALQLNAKTGLATPANWEAGAKLLIPPSVSDEDARARYPKGFKTLKPWFRETPNP